MAPLIHQLLLSRRENRPDRPFADGRAEYITIHQTGNRRPGADAHAHALWLAGSAPYSWHATIDDSEIWQSLRWDEQGWHAGDGLNGPGNTRSLGLEICVNEGIDAAAAAANAAWLVAHLREQGHGRTGIVQHHHWAGKNCPELIRAESGRWQRFLDQVAALEVVEPGPELSERIARLERIVAGNGTRRLHSPPAASGAPRWQRLTGEEALRYVDGKGDSLHLGLAEVQDRLAALEPPPPPPPPADSRQ